MSGCGDFRTSSVVFRRSADSFLSSDWCSALSMTPRAKLSVVSGPFVTATANTEFAPQRTSSVKVSPLSSTWVSLLRISSAFQPASGLPGVVHGSFCASRPLPSSFAACV